VYVPVNFVKLFVSCFFWYLYQSLLSKFLLYYCYIAYYQEYCISYTEVLIFYADKCMVMGSSENLHVFNFAILLKSRKFDACETYMFYSMINLRLLAELDYFMHYQVRILLSANRS